MVLAGDESAIECLVCQVNTRDPCEPSAVNTRDEVGDVLHVAVSVACLQECVFVRPLAYSLCADAANAADNVILSKSGRKVARSQGRGADRYVARR